MGGHNPVEVAKTVLEVADMAWTAVECCHHHQHHSNHHDGTSPSPEGSKNEELLYLRSENRRLRDLLQQNLSILRVMAESPSFVKDCPPDLHVRILEFVESGSFLNQLESLRKKSNDGSEFPFMEASGEDLQKAELLINIDIEEPSWWVWVTDDMVPRNMEERSEIDLENYVVVTEEHVVDSVANFMAKCIMSNPKAQKMPPEELQKTLTKAFGGMNKVEKVLSIWHAGKLFYALSTWGLALAGLYNTRAALRLAAMGVHKTSKVALRVL